MAVFRKKKSRSVPRKKSYLKKKILYWMRRQSIIAWLIHCLIMYMTVFCMGKAFSDDPPWIIAWFTPMNTIVEKIGTMLIAVAQRLKPHLQDGVRKTIFEIFAVAGSIIPPVYSARSNRRKGVLIGDMTKYFFPMYGVVLLSNFILSVEGQSVAGIQKWQYPLTGVLVTTVYAVTLILATGLVDAVSDAFVGSYIRKMSKGLCSKAPKEEISQFLSELSSHISQRLVMERTPHCITSNGLKKSIITAVRLVAHKLPDISGENCEMQNFSDEFMLIFDSPDVSRKKLFDDVYRGIPAIKERQNSFQLQVEFAGEFWKVTLNTIEDYADKVSAVCRIFDSIEKEQDTSRGYNTIMGCGLVLYLYKQNCSAPNKHEKDAANNCAQFINEMMEVFRADIAFQGVNGCVPDRKVCLFADLIALVWVISEMEHYVQGDLGYKSIPTQIITAFWHTEYACLIRKNLTADGMDCYIALAICLVKQLPSPVNRPLTQWQLGNLRKYVLGQQSAIGEFVNAR